MKHAYDRKLCSHLKLYFGRIQIRNIGKCSYFLKLHICRGKRLTGNVSERPKSNLIEKDNTHVLYKQRQ